MTELHVEAMSKADLIAYLVAHIYPSAGALYKNAVSSALWDQPSEKLVAMAKQTHDAQLERQEKRRALRAARKAQQNGHTS